MAKTGHYNYQTTWDSSPFVFFLDNETSSRSSQTDGVAPVIMSYRFSPFLSLRTMCPGRASIHQPQSLFSIHLGHFLYLPTLSYFRLAHKDCSVLTPRRAPVIAGGQFSVDILFAFPRNIFPYFMEFSCLRIARKACEVRSARFLSESRFFGAICLRCLCYECLMLTGDVTVKYDGWQAVVR